MLGHRALGVDLGGPSGDQGGICACFEGCPVAGQALVAVGEAAAGRLAFEVVGVVVVAGVGEPVQGIGQPGRGEDLGEPGVDRIEDDGLA